MDLWRDSACPFHGRLEGALAVAVPPRFRSTVVGSLVDRRYLARCKAQGHSMSAQEYSSRYPSAHKAHNTTVPIPCDAGPFLPSG